MKMRLFLGKIIIQMNAISEIKISDKMYYKRNLQTSLEIQDFYHFIRKNKDNISYLKFNRKDSSPSWEVEYYIEDGLLHNLYHEAKYNRTIGQQVGYHRSESESPAIWSDYISSSYYIRGEHKTKKEWEEDPERKQLLRTQKLRRIVEENNKI